VFWCIHIIAALTTWAVLLEQLQTPGQREAARSKDSFTTGPTRSGMCSGERLHLRFERILESAMNEWEAIELFEVEIGSGLPSSHTLRVACGALADWMAREWGGFRRATEASS
jgi:hypothetical protein